MSRNLPGTPSYALPDRDRARFLAIRIAAAARRAALSLTGDPLVRSATLLELAMAAHDDGALEVAAVRVAQVEAIVWVNGEYDGILCKMLL